MDKLNFSNAQNMQINEYDLFGWQFSNGTQKKVLIVNLTGNNSKIDLSAVSKNNLNYEIISSGKQTILKTAADAKRTTGTANNNIIDIPPFSAVTINL
jgi:hypothetical protein